MKNREADEPNQMSFSPVRRRSVSVTQAGLIETGCLQPARTLPLVIQPAIDGVSLVAWAGSHLEFIETKLSQHGGLLFRNFNVKTASEFERFIKAISGELLDYVYRSTPRTQVTGNIYTSTEYPADQAIPLHNEMAYSRSWPMKIWFFCGQSAERGGETPIADSRKVFRRIDPQIRERFMQKGVMYVRTYGDALDLPWRNVFQTTNNTEVEDYCRRAGIEFEWTGRDCLKTRQVCQAAAAHPKTGEMVWFNQAHLFHMSSLQAAVRESLLALFKEENLPRNACYGDGSPIESAALDAVRQAYQQEAVVFPWQDGDILMLDNMLVAHGRAPFAGPRNILVGMAESFNGEII